MTKTSKTYDVLIVGGGPAGSCCAMALQASGLRVALLEKTRFPRNKVCGDAIPLGVVRWLSRVDPDCAKALQNLDTIAPIRTIRLVSPKGKAYDRRWYPDSFTCKRADFDAFLLNWAAKAPNLDVFMETAVNTVDVDATGVAVETDNNQVFRAKIVIGCDGSNSVIRKQLTDTRIDPAHYGVAVRAYYKHLSGLPPATLEFHFIKGIVPGYLWIYPMHDNTANVGLGMLSRALIKNKSNIRDLFHMALESPGLRHRFANAEMVGKLEGHSLPLGSRTIPVSGNRFMLCGDAASLVDPLAGDGIGQAVFSGIQAGWHAQHCAEQNDFSAAMMHAYDEVLAAKYRRNFSKRYLLQRFVSANLWLIGLSFTLFGFSAKSHLLVKRLID